MRLISQDGEIDVPYECGSLCIGFIKGEEHIIDTISYYNYSSQKGTKLAEYSTKAKAIKVMEMLKSAYTDFTVINSCLLSMEDLHPTFLNIVNEKIPKALVPYFRFPKDEEVEV